MGSNEWCASNLKSHIDIACAFYLFIRQPHGSEGYCQVEVSNSERPAR